MKTVKKLITATLLLATIGFIPAARAMDDEHKESAEEYHIRLYQQLQEACTHNDPGQVIQLLRAGAPVNDPRRAGEVYDAPQNEPYTEFKAEQEYVEGENSPLHIAAVNENIELAEQLLEHNASINGTGHYDRTPLHYASKNGHHAMVRMLLSRGANVHVMDQSPLFEAASNGHTEVAQTLLDHDANPNAGDNVGTTPLHEAAHDGNVTLTQILLEHKANLNAPNGYNETPLFHATIGNKVKTAELLLQHRAHVNTQTKSSGPINSGTTPLHWAAEKGYSELACLLLDHGADPHITTASRKTAFALATKQYDFQFKHYETLTALLLAGAYEPQLLTREMRRGSNTRYAVEKAQEQACALSTLLCDTETVKEFLLPEIVDIVHDFTTIPVWLLASPVGSLPTQEQIAATTTRRSRPRLAQNSNNAAASPDNSSTDSSSEADDKEAAELENDVQPPLPQSAPEQLLPTYAADADHSRPVDYFINQITEQLEQRLAVNTSEGATDANISQYNELCRQLRTEAGLHDNQLTTEQFNTVIALFNSTLYIPQEQIAAASAPADDEKDEAEAHAITHTVDTAPIVAIRPRTRSLDSNQVVQEAAAERTDKDHEGLPREERLRKAREARTKKFGGH